MYVPALLLPLVWSGVLGAMAFMVLAHVGMLVGMLAVLVRRRAELRPALTDLVGRSPRADRRLRSATAPEGRRPAEDHLIDVAPDPDLARLERTQQRVPGVAGVGRRVRPGEASQHPTWPQVRHSRRWTQR